MKWSGLEGNVPKMAVVRLLYWMHLMSAVLVPFFLDWGRLSYAAIFALQGWFMVACFLFEVPTGAVADRFGRRVSVALAGGVAAGATLLYGSVPSLPVFVAGETLFAVALTLASGADEALVYDSLKALGREAEATRVVARLESFKLGGILAGALVGGVVAARLGVRAPMLLQALPMGLSALLALTLVEPPRGRGVEVRERWRQVLSGGLHHFRSHPELRALAVDQVSVGAVAFLVVWLYQPQLLRVGFPLAAFGVVHAAMGLGQIGLLSKVAVVERLVGGRARLVRLAAVLPPLAFLGLAAATGAAWSIALILLAATFGLARPPLFSGALHARIPSEQRATVISAVSALRTLAIVPAYLLVGAVTDRSLVLTLAGLGVAGLAVALLAAAPAHLFDEDPARAGRVSP